MSWTPKGVQEGKEGQVQSRSLGKAETNEQWRIILQASDQGAYPGDFMWESSLENSGHVTSLRNRILRMYHCLHLLPFFLFCKQACIGVSQG